MNGHSWNPIKRLWWEQQHLLSPPSVSFNLSPSHTLNGSSSRTALNLSFFFFSTASPINGGGGVFNWTPPVWPVLPSLCFKSGLGSLQQLVLICACTSAVCWCWRGVRPLSAKRLRAAANHSRCNKPALHYLHARLVLDSCVAARHCLFLFPFKD